MAFSLGNALHWWVQNRPDFYGDDRRGWWKCLACSKPKKATIFLKSVIFNLKYLTSTAIVAIPTAIAVETKAATCAFPAPFSIRVPPNGNAINPGINEKEPIIILIIIPINPESCPSKILIVSVLINVNKTTGNSYKL